jgi:hypothetical protein
VAIIRLSQGRIFRATQGRCCPSSWLAEALRVVGVHLAKLELADRKKDEEERRHFYQALEGLR